MEPRGYRMVVSTEFDYVKACGIAERQLLEWLRSKNYDPSGLDEGRTEIAPHATLDRDSESGRKGAYSRWRMRETHSATSGTWQSTLIVRSGLAEDQGRTWVQVDVEHQPPEGQFPTRANTPNIVRSLLDALEARDAQADVTTAPVFVEADEVDDTIEELCDSNRRMPVVMATVPYGKDPDNWSRTVVEPLFRNLHGLAVLYVLTPEAQSKFNAALEFHPVFGGGVRTYLPGVDPAWKPDAQRHPVMSRRTIEAAPRRAASILAALPQRLSSRQPLPAALLSIPRQRTRPRLAADGTDVVRLRTDMAAVTALLDEAERAEAMRVDEINDLYAELAKAEQATNELRGENEELYDKVQESQRLIRFLREQLQEAGEFGAAHALAAPTEIDYPKTFSDLLDRLDELPGISFTGNAKITRALDSQSVDNWLYVAWDGLLALDHFARSSADGAASGDFLSWCKSDASSDFPFPTAKVAMRESDTVARNAKLRNERMLPVPKDVAPAGQVFMQAHLKVGGGNTIAPRLHFYDDCIRSGKVYVGYLGPHLRNTLT
ncbi:hypothetical protein [Streptomyces pseudogriseolus]|uniref:Uncharacterized protein n=1 Tax=Streptomyces pseudogriseolus TaxID=36817 RepID=A0ABQ2SHL3_STREZ|nr:hypothetical protein [Streptomyces rubiginosus]GGS28935.1 hypothetical protein GCM10010285_04160 [Streptomyces rubiginosus]